MTSTSPPPTQFLTIQGHKLAFDDTGGPSSSPVFLGLPGMGDLRSEYRHLRPLLVEAGFRVVTLDVRGCGDTDATWEDHSARAIAGDALAVMDHLKIPKAFVAGNSFAAGSTLWAAKEAPQRVAGCILLGPIIRELPVSAAIKAVLWLGFSRPWRTWFWMTYWDSLFPLKKPVDHPQNRATLKKNLAESPARMDSLWKMLNIPKHDTEAILDSHQGPTLIVMGTKDPDFSDPSAEARDLAKRLHSKEEALLVEGSGHYPHAEVPEKVGPAVIQFIKANQ